MSNYEQIWKYFYVLTRVPPQIEFESFVFGFSDA